MFFRAGSHFGSHQLAAKSGSNSALRGSAVHDSHHVHINKSTGYMKTAGKPAVWIEKCGCRNSYTSINKLRMCALSPRVCADAFAGEELQLSQYVCARCALSGEGAAVGLTCVQPLHNELWKVCACCCCWAGACFHCLHLMPSIKGHTGHPAHLLHACSCFFCTTAKVPCRCCHPQARLFGWVTGKKQCLRF